MTALHDFFTISDIKGGLEQLIWNQKVGDKISQRAQDTSLICICFHIFLRLSFIEDREKFTE